MIANPKPKRRKTSPRRAAVKSADDAFSRYIKARDGNRCVQCGERERVTCGHLYTRAAYATRWNPDNAAAQCIGCNLRHEHDFIPFYRYFIDKYGQEKVDDLYTLHKSSVHFKTYQIEEIARFFNKKADELSGGAA